MILRNIFTGQFGCQRFQIKSNLKNLNYFTIAIGDSYNDITMLKEADTGILFRPPENVKNEFREFPVTNSYDELKIKIQHLLLEP